MNAEPSHAGLLACADGDSCCAEEQSERVLRDVEAQFATGVRRKNYGGTIGLGL